MILSIIVLIIIVYGLYKKNDIFNEFIDGAKESYTMIKSLFPSLLAMILSVNIFIKSGFLSFILNYISIPFIPKEIVPLMILRPISGSASLAVLTNIFKTYGPDSYIGMLSSVMQGSTDTTIYILILYFGAINIKKTRYALVNGLLADLCAFIISIIIVNLFIH